MSDFLKVLFEVMTLVQIETKSSLLGLLIIYSIFCLTFTSCLCWFNELYTDDLYGIVTYTAEWILSNSFSSLAEVKLPSRVK